MALLPYLGTAAAGLFSGWAGQKIANRGNDQSIAKRMSALGNADGGQQPAGGGPRVYGDMTGKKGGVASASIYEPWQEQGQKDVFNMGMEGMKNNNFSFDPIEQQALQNWDQRDMPNLMERMTSLEGDQRSSGFFNMLNQGREGLATNLAAQKAQYGQQQQDRYMQMLGFGGKPQYENMYIPRQPGTGESLATSLLPAGITAGATFGAAYLQNRGMKDILAALKK